MAKSYNADNILDEMDVSKSSTVRKQKLAKAWQSKFEGALDHSLKLYNLWTSGYFQKGYARWHMINLMNRGVSTVVSYLVEGNPRINIEPLSPNLRQFAYSMKLITNYLIERENFAENVLIPGATASMFGAGIARTFFEYDRAVDVDGEKIKIGTPKVSIIEPCDYIGDPSAKYRKDFAIEGDVYKLPTKYAKDLFAKKDQFGRQVADYIKPDCNLNNNFSTKQITENGSFDYNRLALEEYTTFIDIYNHRDRTIETIMPEGTSTIVFNTTEWKGPDTPYDYLGYKYMPGCPVPLPPAWDWYDLDVTMNIVAKAARQSAEGQKDIVAAEPANKDAAQAVLDGKHGQIALVKGMEGVKQFTFGGVKADNYGWMDWAEAQFTKSGTASSDVMAGRGASAPTLGQEQLVVANASRIINNFYNRYHEWQTSILKKWVWAVIENPSTYVEVLDTIKLPGIGDYEYPVYYSKADKVAEFYDLSLKVVPYSSQRKSPEVEYQRLFQFMTSWILPTMEMRMQQGASIDLEMVDKLLADYGGFDNFPSWYKGVLPSDQPEALGIMKTGKGQGQQNDALGASEPSRIAQSMRVQNTQGFGAESKLPQVTGDE